MRTNVGSNVGARFFLIRCNFYLKFKNFILKNKSFYFFTYSLRILCQLLLKSYYKVLLCLYLRLTSRWKANFLLFVFNKKRNIFNP